ncbi:MAG: hypothetical protein PHI98_12560 [Eubacteriales bacterium]|nr:hypothetical protein [Eubacteriales bacterium]
MNGNPNAPHRYDDMLALPHHVSKKHPQMSPENRAAQFAPFAALTGYGAAVKETARLTDQRIEMDDDDKILLNGKLQRIQENLKVCPEVVITFFQHDEKKDGGVYVTVTGIVKNVDEHQRQIVMVNEKNIPIDDVIAIDGELFRGMDEAVE